MASGMDEDEAFIRSLFIANDDMEGDEADDPDWLIRHRKEDFASDISSVSSDVPKAASTDNSAQEEEKEEESRQLGGLDMEGLGLKERKVMIEDWTAVLRFVFEHRAQMEEEVASVQRVFTAPHADTMVYHNATEYLMLPMTDDEYTTFQEMMKMAQEANLPGPSYNTYSDQQLLKVDKKVREQMKQLGLEYVEWDIEDN